MRSRRGILISVAVLGLLAAAALWLVVRPGGRSAPRRSLVLYCATDREIAQVIIERFQQQSGIQVDVKYDTEAAKAVGLVQAIRQEKDNPQCDVLWGGGPFFCSILADEGCLAAAPPDLVAAHGGAPRDARGRWLGVGGSYRVLIVNTDLVPEADRPTSYRDLANPAFKGHTGIANPLFGGMAAHVAALFAKEGEAEGRRFLQALRDNDVALCSGMADVRNRVAAGELWFGLTSTVDAHIAVESGKPVTVIFPDQGPADEGAFPWASTAGLIANARHPREAEAFLRFLMSSETERLLAAGPAQNVGLLPESVAADIRPAWIPKRVKSMSVDWPATVAAHPAAVKAVREILLNP